MTHSNIFIVRVFIATIFVSSLTGCSSISKTYGNVKEAIWPFDKQEKKQYYLGNRRKPIYNPNIGNNPNFNPFEDTAPSFPQNAPGLGTMPPAFPGEDPFNTPSFQEPQPFPMPPTGSQPIMPPAYPNAPTFPDSPFPGPNKGMEPAGPQGMLPPANMPPLQAMPHNIQHEPEQAKPSFFQRLKNSWGRFIKWEKDSRLFPPTEPSVKPDPFKSQPASQLDSEPDNFQKSMHTRPDNPWIPDYTHSTEAETPAPEFAAEKAADYPDLSTVPERPDALKRFETIRQSRQAEIESLLNERDTAYSRQQSIIHSQDDGNGITKADTALFQPDTYAVDDSFNTPTQPQYNQGSNNTALAEHSESIQQQQAGFGNALKQTGRFFAAPFKALASKFQSSKSNTSAPVIEANINTAPASTLPPSFQEEVIIADIDDQDAVKEAILSDPRIINFEHTSAIGSVEQPVEEPIVAPALRRPAFIAPEIHTLGQSRYAERWFETRRKRHNRR